MKAPVGACLLAQRLTIAIQFTVASDCPLWNITRGAEGFRVHPSFVLKAVSPAASNASGKFCNMRESSNDRDFPESEYSFPGS